jgi:hypothetical protein
MSDDHLTEREQAQIELWPASDAVISYTDTSAAARSRLTAVGIDADRMAVDVYWVGGILDSVTEAAFTRITETTGTPITVIPTRFSRQDYSRAMEAIAASQPGVRNMSGVNDEIIVGVAPETMTVDRPPEVGVPGKDLRVPVRYEPSDMEPDGMAETV